MLPLNPVGLKMVPVTPLPDHVPPASPVIKSDKSIGAASAQIAAGADHAAFDEFKT